MIFLSKPDEIRTVNYNLLVHQHVIAQCDDGNMICGNLIDDDGDCLYLGSAREEIENARVLTRLERKLAGIVKVGKRTIETIEIMDGHEVKRAASVFAENGYRH